MKSILEELLSKKIDELKKQRVHGQKIVNAIKGDVLHPIVLNYLYSHKIYKYSVMYGGTALKMIYDLPRMSVDLDFQINFPFNGERFEKETKDYFKNQFGYERLDIMLGSENKDTIVVKLGFPGFDKFGIPDISFAKLKVRLDFNRFDTDQFLQILVPKKFNNTGFYIRTYPVSTLMASKVTALLNRTQYSAMGESKKSLMADYKGRDIYDIIWYMKHGVIPNLRYLQERGHDYQDYPSLFKKIKERLSSLADGGRALRNDLNHLYLAPEELEEWINRWDELFLESLRNYAPMKIMKIDHVRAGQNFDNDHYSFIYSFETDLNQRCKFVVVVSDRVVEDLSITGFKRDDIRVGFHSGVDAGDDKIVEYAGLFYSKIEDFLKRIGHISPRQKIQTKLIQLSFEGYDPNTTVVLADRALKECQFEDLL